jgi:glucose/arabinose dehydrogenase
MKNVPILLAVALAMAAQNSGERPIDVRLVTHVYRPAGLEPTDARVAQLRVPPGFRVQKFAEGLENPRILAVAGDGTVYVTRREQGDVVMLRDTNNDGRADARRVVAKREGMHGIAIRGERVYLATIKEVFVTDRKADGSFGPLKAIVTDLPDGGQHPNRTIGVGPDNMLYISVGSSCNACDEPNPEHATMLRTGLNGGKREIYARGLRNTVGFGWHPESREFWGLDHGTDWLGDFEQKEELNRIVEGAHYGWPKVHEFGKINPKEFPEQVDVKKYTDPVLLYTAHAAPMQMVFYRGEQFPAEYRTDAFATMRGSWNRRPPDGYEVVRIRFKNSQPVSIEPFVVGFLVHEGGDVWKQFGRPVGIAVAGDGSLLFTDDTHGVIYRVSYDGPPGDVTRR